MLTNLREINRLLLGVRELSAENGALTRNVIEHCSGIVMEGSIVNHQETIDFCLDVGLLHRKYDRIKTSELGDQFLYFNRSKEYALNSEQKNFLALSCFLKGQLAKMVREILVQFKPDHRKMTFVWSREYGYHLKADDGLLSLLFQSEILFKSSDIIMVNPEYAYLVSSFHASNKMTQEELEERLAEHNEIGKIAEEIVTDYEKRRLLETDCKVEADRVLNISNIDVGAGYDIMSFNNKSMDYDRFIEVKGSKNKEISFVLSKNEIEKAKELGTDYWLYFIGGVNTDNRTGMEPQIFQDPVKSILGNQDFNSDCLRILVKRKPLNDRS